MAFNVSRYKGISSKEFDIEIVTPMFLGGASVSGAELRVPSIKGMLRFWWRATCGIEKIPDMKKKEALIFGSTDNKASFSLQITKQKDIKSVSKNLPVGELYKVKSTSQGRTFEIGIIDYLAFGLRDFRRGYTREHIPSGKIFRIRFLFYNKIFEQEVLNAFYTFITFGGLGAKTRNGFGSLHTNIGEKLSISAGDQKSFSAISDGFKLFNHFNTHKKWEDALSEIGLAYKDARLSVENKHSYNRRLLIARPIIQANNSNNSERHAKPYFLHVNKLNTGMYQGQILFVPYKYLEGCKKYSETKYQQYLETCGKMNTKIAEIMKGAK